MPTTPRINKLWFTVFLGLGIKKHVWIQHFHFCTLRVSKDNKNRWKCQAGCCCLALQWKQFQLVKFLKAKLSFDKPSTTGNRWLELWCLSTLCFNIKLTSFICSTIPDILRDLSILLLISLTADSFNKRQISRIYPKGTRVDSSNYMPQVRAGHV